MEKIQNIIAQAHKYIAHLPANNSSQNAETIEEHSDLVYNYTQILIAEYELIPVIKNLLQNSFKLQWTEAFTAEIIELFFESIYLHDLGKINPNFQVVKMKNCHFKKEQFKFGTDHSLPGYIAFIHFAFQKSEKLGLEMNEQMETVFLTLAILFGYQVAKHHASHLSNLPQYLEDKFDFTDEDILKFNKDLEKLLQNTNVSKSSEFNIEHFAPVSAFMAQWLKQEVQNSFPLFAIQKLHYSLLTASDYLATMHYMNNWGSELLKEFGTISTKLKEKIILNARTKKEYNRNVYDSLNGFQFLCPQQQSGENLNRLRKELAVEVVKIVRKYPNDLIYYIEAPTGGGKTNLSMLALAEILEQHNAKNVYYVFPFTSLITQTYSVLKDTLNLNDDEVVELHSKAGFPEKNHTAQYGKDKQNHIDFLFANYPICLLSHVKFFDILKTNRKESNYLLHRLANSVVIVDELQSYPPKHWDKLGYFIDNYARYFNIRFILMSATLPKIGDMNHVKTKVRYLIEDKNKYFQNPNFCKRVQFDYSLLEWVSPAKHNTDQKNSFLQNLAEKVIIESANYAKSNIKYPESVFTIAEFIYKQTATDFYTIIEENHPGFFDDIFVLSGTILEYRRKEIIYFLKNKNNRSKKVLLITTQVVEAGVDIDMDLGFKDQSLVDSDEQLAGRINRNVNKPQCKLFLFNCDNANVIYGSDKRFKLMQKEFYKDYKTILETKDFDKLYTEVMRKLDAQVKNTIVCGLDDFEKKVQALHFQDVDSEFRIINQQNESIYIPLSIPVYVNGSTNKERNFTETDINFLSSYGINESDGRICGEDVFQLYKTIIQNQNCNFVEKKTEIKKLQGILNQFTFSLISNSSILRNIKGKGSGEEKMGFYYLHHWQNDSIYNPNLGLQVKNDSFICL